MYLHWSKYEDILDIRNNEQERTNMHISRLYFPVILDDFIPPPSFRSYGIDVSNYFPTRADHLSRTRATFAE